MILKWTLNIVGAIAILGGFLGLFHQSSVMDGIDPNARINRLLADYHDPVARQKALDALDQLPAEVQSVENYTWIGMISVIVGGLLILAALRLKPRCNHPTKSP